jgi:hypothetical protein
VCRKDDQVVRGGERVAGPRPLEILLGEEVHLPAGQPAQEADVVGAELRRDAPVEEGAAEADRDRRDARVPGVAQPSPSSSRKLYACHVFVGMTTATRLVPRRGGRTRKGV